MAGPSALSFIGMIIMAMMMIVRNGDDDGLSMYSSSTLPGTALTSLISTVLSPEIGRGENHKS